MKETTTEVTASDVAVSVLRCINLQSSTPNPSVQNSSAQVTGRYRSGKSLVNPPHLPPPPPPDVLQLAEHLRAVLGLDQQHLEELWRKSVLAHGLELLKEDYFKYSQRVKKDQGFISANDFEAENSYQDWKRAELECLCALRGTTPRNESSVLLRFCVIQAVNLLAKDGNGSSNPYCVITVGGEEYVSEPLMKTLNPQWRFEVPITVNSTSEILVSIWNRRDARKGDGFFSLSSSNDAFLGLVSLTWQDIFAVATESIRMDAWFDLQKRSSRSNVRGKVRLTARNLKDLSTFHQTAGRLERYLRTFLQTFFGRWRIGVQTPIDQSELQAQRRHLVLAVTILDVMNVNPVLMRMGSSNKSADLSQLVRSLLLEGIDACYCEIQSSSSDSQNDGLALFATVKSLCTMLQAAHQHLDVILLGIHVPSLMAAFFFDQVRMKLDALPATYSALSLELAHVFELYSVVLELQNIYEQIDHRLAEQFKICDWFLPFVNEWISLSGKKLTEWLENAIKVDTWESISSTVLHSSSVLDLFVCFQQQIEFVMNLAWQNVDQSSIFMKQVVEMVVNALEWYASHMKLLILKEMSGQRNDLPKQLPSSTLSPPVTSATSRPSATENITSKKAESSRKSRKFRLRFGKLKRSSLDPQEVRVYPQTLVKLNNIQCLPTRLGELLEKIPKAEKALPPEPAAFRQEQPIASSLGSKPEPPPKDHGRTYSGRVFKQSKHLLRLQVLRGHNIVTVRPYTTMLYCRISSPGGGGRIIGQTRPVLQRMAPSWASSATKDQPRPTEDDNRREEGNGGGIFSDKESSTGMYAILSEQEVSAGLELSLIQRVPLKGDYVVARGAIPIDINGLSVSAGQSSLDNYVNGGSSEVDFWVNLGTSGHILVRMSVEEEDFLTFALKKLNWRCKVVEEEVTEALVGKLCDDLRDRFKKTAEKYKQSMIDKFALKSVTQSDLSSINEEAEKDLSPVFTYFNGNFEILMDWLPEDTALAVIQRVWSRVLEVAESLLVPNLAAMDEEKKVWDEKRVSFLKVAIELLVLWFNGEGNGLDMDTLNTDMLRQLRLTLEWYFVPKKDLKAKFLTELEGVRQQRKDSMNIQ
ncbi:hypothetical protein HK102_009082, partial [Quaeritorhiza haematococci]